jgi:hypothetical protein
MRELQRRGHQVFRVTPEQSASRYGNVADADMIINWGCSAVPTWTVFIPWLNLPSSVNHMSHKVRMFQVFSRAGIQPVPWATRREHAQGWLDANRRVAVRHVLQGHSGEGMEIVHPGEELPDAPLYTKLVRGPNVREFRVIFIKGQPLLWMRKRRRDGGNADDLVRTHANGWIYASRTVWDASDEGQNIVVGNVMRMLRRLERQAVDFGALDILADVVSGEVWALEVNTAPGLASPSTLNAVVGGIVNV